jgi:hypothetical protein
MTPAEFRRGEAEPPGGIFNDEAVAHQHGADLFAAGETRRRLDGDLRSDAVGVAQGDGDAHYL